jgi:predicted transcriptional regulator
MVDEDNIDTNMNEKWECIKTVIKETKEWFIEKDEKAETLKNKWYVQEYKIAIAKMKKAREMWLIKVRRENEEQEYHHKRKEAHKIIRNKQKVYLKNVIESIEKDQKHNNSRKMYQTINQCKK